MKTPPFVLRPGRTRRMSEALRQLREARLALVAEYRITEAAELQRIIERLEAAR